MDHGLEFGRRCLIADWCDADNRITGRIHADRVIDIATVLLWTACKEVNELYQ